MSRQPDGKLHLLRTVARYGAQGGLEVQSAGDSHPTSSPRWPPPTRWRSSLTGRASGGCDELDVLLLERP
jgi:hypothetical protein